MLFLHFLLEFLVSIIVIFYVNDTRFDMYVYRWSWFYSKI